MTLNHLCIKMVELAFLELQGPGDVLGDAELPELPQLHQHPHHLAVRQVLVVDHLGDKHEKEEEETIMKVEHYDEETINDSDLDDVGHGEGDAGVAVEQVRPDLDHLADHAGPLLPLQPVQLGEEGARHLLGPPPLAPLVELVEGLPVARLSADLLVLGEPLPGLELLATTFLLVTAEVLASVVAAPVLAQTLHRLVGLVAEDALEHGLPPVLQLLVGEQLSDGCEGDVAVLAPDDVLEHAGLVLVHQEEVVARGAKDDVGGAAVVLPLVLPEVRVAAKADGTRPADDSAPSLTFVMYFLKIAALARRAAE